jgi:DNA-binding transcriptional ArsR family regulator
VSSEEKVSRGNNHTVQDVYYLENIEQLEAISDPIRYRMYSMMTQPKTGAQLARALGISRSRAHYHLNILKDVGLVAFCGEGISHGITEKYYQVIALNLDFSNLIPKDHQGVVPSEITLRSFKAASKFIATMLDISRERIAKLEVHERVGIGYHYTLEPRLTPDQFQLVKDELVALKDRIVDMNRENWNSTESLPLVDCGVTLFLTPLSYGILETESGNVTDDAGVDE